MEGLGQHGLRGKRSDWVGKGQISTYQNSQAVKKHEIGDKKEAISDSGGERRVDV